MVDAVAENMVTSLVPGVSLPVTRKSPIQDTDIPVNFIAHQTAVFLANPYPRNQYH